ncbi:hypothetical protein JOD82_002314 [Paenibacillus sp. 1182]|uniref:hypothetical protein n=1 Tax=Paenibacillus sp. 1182 TaxID=2806565 RepID=UPI001AE6C6A0|nr:hypothetical protein [Paenibacillus sp. 1182]MBP1309294.1 hypothetical protein [Paenibacillus sp. 1182]
MFERMFGKKDSVDVYEKQRLVARKQEEQEERKDKQAQPLYSVMIHFTPMAPFVYILKNDTFMTDDGVVIVANSLHSEMRVGGSFIYQNELGGLQEVEMFLKEYHIQNPIRMNIWRNEDEMV